MTDETHKKLIESVLRERGEALLRDSEIDKWVNEDDATVLAIFLGHSGAEPLPGMDELQVFTDTRVATMWLIGSRVRGLEVPIVAGGSVSRLVGAGHSHGLLVGACVGKHFFGVLLWASAPPIGIGYDSANGFRSLDRDEFISEFGAVMGEHWLSTLVLSAYGESIP